MEKTFAMLKPGILQRRLVGEVISRLESKGFKIVALKMLTLTKELARKHYKEHINKDFYKGLEEYILSGPVIALVLEGENSIQALRNIVGSTSSLDAENGTIRGDLGLSNRKNIIHASDSVESAEREIDIYFSKEEIMDYCDNNSQWIY